MMTARILLRLLFPVVLLMPPPLHGICQETVFSLFKNDLKLADEYVADKRYENALALYLKVAKKDKQPQGTQLKIARCYYGLKQYHQAIFAYEQYAEKYSPLPLSDVYSLAEACASTKNYEKAIAWYRNYLAERPGAPDVLKKLWQLQNIHYLYEDSLHLTIRPVALNTDYGELCATFYNGGIVFMSNRKVVQVIDNIDASSNAAFYKLYHSTILQDTATDSGLQYGAPSLFKTPTPKLHEGPAIFYNHEKHMVYVSSSEEAGSGGRTLQLFFAAQEDGKWKSTGAFPYNSTHYSITDPTISEDGKVLYFSADMEGGQGGKDLYRSEYINNKWTQPTNLGEQINTPHDDVFPYLHQNKVLYFSSNGHPGLGGLDLFKASITAEGFGEITNLGYPLNTHHDEFGIVLDSTNVQGYLTSNRKQGGLNDDLYAFEMDVQAYPLIVSGVVRYKEFNWSDSSQLKPLAHARLNLVDNMLNTSIYETHTDSLGHFVLHIPYFSQYKIHIIGEDHEENIVSFEIPKHRKADNEHEIVVVKDPLKERK